MLKSGLKSQILKIKTILV